MSLPPLQRKTNHHIPSMSLRLGLGKWFGSQQWDATLQTLEGGSEDPEAQEPLFGSAWSIEPVPSPWLSPCKESAIRTCGFLPCSAQKFLLSILQAMQSLRQWFSTRGASHPPGTGSISGDIFDCQKPASSCGEGGIWNITAVWWVEAREALKHPKWQPSTPEDHPSQKTD